MISAKWALNIEDWFVNNGRQKKNATVKKLEEFHMADNIFREVFGDIGSKTLKRKIKIKC